MQGSVNVDSVAKLDPEEGFKLTDDPVEHDVSEDMHTTINSESHKGNWIHSAFHTTTAMVGAGVLGLPASFASLTWAGGIVVLTAATLISYYTILQLTWMHEVTMPNGKIKRMNRYQDLTQYLFGKRGGWWILVPFQIAVCVGLGIAYIITGGNSLTNIWQLTCPTFYNSEVNEEQCSTSFGKSLWVVVFAGCQLLLSQVPTFTELAVVSLVGAVCSLGYSTIAWILSVIHGTVPNVAYNWDTFSTADVVFGFMNAMANIAFAYGGHNISLEIQSTLPYPSVKPMTRGINIAYIITPYCYYCVSIAGYWAFGNLADSEIIDNFDGPKSVLIVANVMIVLHVLASYQVFTFIVYDMIERALARKGVKINVITRLVYRSAYVVATGFIAVLLPFFGDIVGLIGAIGTTPTSYAIPSICWLKLKKPKPTSWHFWASWASILGSLLVFVVGTVGSVRNIIVDITSGEYKLLGIGM